VAFIAAILLAMPAVDELRAQETEAKADPAVNTQAILEKVAGNLASKQKYRLQYKMPKGTEFRWNVEHVTSNKTRISRETEEVWTRTLSTRVYQVEKVNPDASVEFGISLSDWSMWQKNNDKPPISYDSSKPKESVPAEFQGILSRIGVTLSKYKVKPSGQVISRASERSSVDLGLGDVLIPFPDEEISVGHKWHVPRTYPVTTEDGRVEQIPIRTRYEFEKVVDNKAYISVQSQILVPVESEKVRMELLQQMSRGFAVLDLDLGMLVQQEYEWNERVQGYPTPDAYLQYSCKITSKLDREGLRAQLAAESGKEQTHTALKPYDGKPVLRR
jgi:hypothetical protein